MSHKHTHRSSKQGKRNQGEGDKASAREYNAELQKFVAAGEVEPAAQAAKDFVESNPAEASAAEETAKLGPEPVAKRFDELRLEGKALLAKAKAKIKDLFARS